MAKDRSQLHADANSILHACLDAADPEAAVKNALRLRDTWLDVKSELEMDLREFDRVFVVGGGKGSAPMARAVEDILGERLTGGIISVKYGYGFPLERVRVMEAGHPVPDRAGEAAARAILDLLAGLAERDLVISCISGGGSALLPSPPEGIELEDKQALTNLLLSVGATIHEINVVRKHISLTKGGNLMRIAYPAFVVNLMLSDVVGDDPDTIASGPFVPDRSTFHQALSVLEKYDLVKRVSEGILERLQEGVAGKIPETPKEDNVIFLRCRNVIVASNFLSLKAGAERAVSLGYATAVLSSSLEGDTEQVAHFHGAVAREIRATGNPLQAPACILSGGETTVVLRGSGKGGRNQHFALCLVEEAARIPRSLFLAAGTDGTDGPTDAAGAAVDDESFSRARSLGLDPEVFMANNDSYNFFQSLGDLIITGPTRTNVMDVRIALIA